MQQRSVSGIKSWAIDGWSVCAGIDDLVVLSIEDDKQAGEITWAA